MIETLPRRARGVDRLLGWRAGCHRGLPRGAGEAGAGHAGNVTAAWRLLRSDAIAVLPIVDDDLPALDGLMQRYADRPMDFADATLVHVANRTGINTVFTVDHDDFLTYRIDKRRRFRIVPDRW